MKKTTNMVTNNNQQASDALRRSMLTSEKVNTPSSSNALELLGQDRVGEPIRSALSNELGKLCKLMSDSQHVSISMNVYPTVYEKLNDSDQCTSVDNVKFTCKPDNDLPEKEEDVEASFYGWGNLIIEAESEALARNYIQKCRVMLDSYETKESTIYVDDISACTSSKVSSFNVGFTLSGIIIAKAIGDEVHGPSRHSNVEFYDPESNGNNEIAITNIRFTVFEVDYLE